jgi:hypothetical protein
MTLTLAPFRATIRTEGADGAAVVTEYTDPKALAATMPRQSYGNGIAPHARDFKLAPATRRRGKVATFDPALGEIGSWVSFPGLNGVTVTGQVWSIVSGGKHPTVCVADGVTFHSPLPVSSLSPASEPAVQTELAEIVAEIVDESLAEIAALATVEAPAEVVAPVTEIALSPQPLTRKARKAEQKVWNRAIADAAREAGTYTEVMARWTTAQELRDNGVSVTDALAELAAA